MSVREEIRGDPGSGVVCTLVALPSNQVAELTLQAVVDFGVQDFGDLVLLFVVDLHQRRRLDFAVRNGAGLVRFELRDVEDGVDGTHILAAVVNRIHVKYMIRWSNPDIKAVGALSQQFLT